VAEEIEHRLKEEPRQLRTAGGAPRGWVASCVCKRYTCQPQKSPGQAVRQVNLHIEAKVK
jgi:hypothetical protein